MNIKLKYLIIVALFIGTVPLSYSQGVGINEDSSPADASAILDVSSTSKGMLVPRMATSEREAIASPATGLLVFDNDTESFWFYTTEWSELGGAGAVTLLNSNIILGENAGTNLINTDSDMPGSSNVAIGTNALSTAESGGNGFNVAVGWNSQPSTGNVAFGNPFGFFFSFGNSTLGARTLEQNTTGAQNGAVGYQAMQNNTTGSANAAVGSFALNRNTTGNGNVAVGLRAGQGNSTGDGNTYIGFDAGRGTNQANDGAEGNMNVTFLGAQTGVSDRTIDYTNSTAVGFGALLTADNQVRIGNADVTSIGGQVDWSTLSDGRYKVNVNENVPGLEFIMRLRPVTYNVDRSKLSKKYKSADRGISAKVETGFIAQEVENAAQKSDFQFDGVNPPQNDDDYYTLSYAKIVVPLTKAVQELQSTLNQQSDEIASLKAEVETLKSNGNKRIQTEVKNASASLD